MSDFIRSLDAFWKRALVAMVGDIVWLTVEVAVLILAIRFIAKRQNYITEINVVWYTASFVFVIYLLVSYAMQFGFLPMAVSSEWSDSSTGWIYWKATHLLTDLNGELILVSVFIAITIGPQVLTYVLSGLSGTAKSPRFVLQFERIAVWSLIKFLAALGGYHAASVIETVSSNRPIFSIYVGSLVTADAARAVFNITAAFAILILQSILTGVAKKFDASWSEEKHSWPYRLHRFFTRNVPREAQQP